MQVIALAEGDIVNPQVYDDRTHIDLDCPSNSDDEWIIKKEGLSILKIPSRFSYASAHQSRQFTHVIPNSLRPTWMRWLKQPLSNTNQQETEKLDRGEPYKTDKVLDDQDESAKRRKRRVRPTNPSSNGKKASERSNIDDHDDCSRNPWVNFRSNPSNLFVMFPSGYKHVCSEHGYPNGVSEGDPDGRITLDGLK